MLSTEIIVDGEDSSASLIFDVSLCPLSRQPAKS
jgi:hypothetical protein